LDLDFLHLDKNLLLLHLKNIYLLLVLEFHKMDLLGQKMLLLWVNLFLHLHLLVYY
jgi:hypothetical protein